MLTATTAATVVNNYPRRMYNHTRRCLITLVTNHRKLWTQSFQSTVVASEMNYCMNVGRLWGKAICKRFYCQAATTNADTLMNDKPGDDAQQELDKFLSDPENEKYFQILELEIDVLRHNAEKVPDKIKPQEWLALLKLTIKSQRKKYLIYLWTKEKSGISQKAKKERKKAEWLAKKAELVEDTGEIKYGLAHNSLFLRIYPSSINHYQNAKLMQAIMFEPKVVFDCGYDSYMNMFETHNCAKQLTIAFATNRSHVNPMCLYFCNMDKEGALMRHVQRNMPNALDDDFPAFITSQSYLDLFPKEKLVYLTPHCRMDLNEYDADTVYIVGAMVDKTNPKPLSLAKAKKEGLRMAKMPIEKYLEWGSGSTKNLTLNQVMAILLDIRHTRNWKEALCHVPTRKLKEAREYMLKRKVEKRSVSSRKPETETSTVPINFTFTNRKNR